MTDCPDCGTAWLARSPHSGQVVAMCSHGAIVSASSEWIYAAIQALS